ncbi:hypothetical protein IEO21_04812 [Rhodonia placenta]|uniref:Rad4-domain-containing protein n=1 Tax=Rhodonia placenta TaxID=104341 RepID=A0A8H7U268_9APHY|nr:hypothetical protein IEO21_04812 [Postia placenta]
MLGSAENSSVAGGDSDDDFDWEEVIVPQADQPEDHAQPLESALDRASDIQDLQEGPSERPNIEITIQTHRRGKKDSPKCVSLALVLRLATKFEGGRKNPRAELIQAERLARLMCHQIHTVSLLANARIRNKWINDPLLHARLMSLTPLHLQNAFSSITRTRYPEAAQRGRMFESAVGRLAEWWGQNFRVDRTGHIRSRTFDEVQKKITVDKKGKGKARALADDLDDDDMEGEMIRSEKSLMKHALMMRGSRDTSAQLFTALCRALGIPTRLVVSLQSVPWQASVGKPKPTTKKPKKKAEAEEGARSDEDDDMEMEEVQIPDLPSATAAAKGKGKEVLAGISQRVGSEQPQVNGADKGKQKAPPVIKLRQSRGRKWGNVPTEQPRRRERTPNPTTTAPVFWAEVFSRADARWLSVDPIRCIVNKRKAFDPTPNPNAVTKPDRSRPVKVENRMVYVVAFEEDSYGRDVTPRYAREFGAKVSKMQQGGKGRKEWWERIIGLVKRPYRLHRDDLEDEELTTNQLTEAMPTSMAGFKNHPLYVLERHLKRDEVIHPPVELGKFRGEPVYPRSSVVALKTAENWMRQGRNVREGAQPMKWVKQRAMTVNKQRAIEMALMEGKSRAGEQGEGDGFAGEDAAMQALYAENQTELYKPNPIINGKVPKNDFGNIDLYVPSMLPAGAVHIPYKGTAKVARQLGFDFAEAVTGFEFKKRRAFPVVTGIVVAAENEEAVLDSTNRFPSKAYWEAEHDAEEKRRAKREEQVIKRWTKLVHGLQIRQRLQEQYAGGEQREGSPSGANEEDVQGQGGFLTAADDVVQPYTLPRNFHEVLPTSTTISLAPLNKQDDTSSTLDAIESRGHDEEHKIVGETGSESDEDKDMGQVVALALPGQSVPLPKTMLELAEAAARQRDELSEQERQIPASPAPESSQVQTRTARANGSGARSTPTGTHTPKPFTKTRSARGSDKRRTRKRTRDDAQSASAGSDVEPATSTKASPAKRARKTVAPVPASDRVLRTRTTKSASKVQEEREMEEAFREAIAE